MAQPQVGIVGAGLSGLVLARCLLQRGIPSVLFERDPSSSRRGYGITLHSWAYKPLLKYLAIDENTFRSKLGGDAAVGADGRVSLTAGAADASSFRANRSKLETVLREGLDIKWGHKLVSIMPHATSNLLTFRDGRQLQSAVVVGADGPHSTLRKSMWPNSDLNVLPFVVYNGKRRVKREIFDEIYAPHMNGANAVERRDGDRLMQITINESGADLVSISYTYSRPAKESDPIFNPERPVSGAAKIPPALFDEIATLQHLEDPFREVFNVMDMRDDRLLNWLMRSILVDVRELRAAAETGVVMMGDSVHAGPILGGYGANAAIQDGVELAEHIIENREGGLPSFIESRYDDWKKYVDLSERQLAKMHGEALPNSVE